MQALLDLALQLSPMVGLAQRFVRLFGELDLTRDAMKRLLMNGAGGQAQTLPQPGGQREAAAIAPPKALRGLQVEKTIFKLVQSSPGMGTVAIAKATAAGRSTPVERLKRLQAKGRIERDGVGWRAPA